MSVRRRAALLAAGNAGLVSGTAGAVASPGDAGPVPGFRRACCIESICCCTCLCQSWRIRLPGFCAVVFGEGWKAVGRSPIVGRSASRIPKYMAAVTAPPAHRTMATAASGPICSPRFARATCFSPDFPGFAFPESFSVRTDAAGSCVFFFSRGGRGRACRVSSASPQRGQCSGTGLVRSRMRSSVRQSGQSSRWIVMSF